MPVQNDDLNDIRRRLYDMFDDTVKTFRAIEEHADLMFKGNRAEIIRKAINECLDDFVTNTEASGQAHPEAIIKAASAAALQWAGFYGSQLILKEQQVTSANQNLRNALQSQGQGQPQVIPNAFGWKRPFHDWIDIINNFLGSLTSAFNVAEALKELKDCLRGEIKGD